jgi:hypothetical protein
LIIAVNVGAGTGKTLALCDDPSAIFVRVPFKLESDDAASSRLMYGRRMNLQILLSPHQH